MLPMMLVQLLLLIFAAGAVAVAIAAFHLLLAACRLPLTASCLLHAAPVT